jgi:two-component system chemotaxis response regulator CheB
MAQELKPDVVILDLELPKKTGIEVLKQIMRNHPIPVLIVSSHAKENAQITLDALQLGAVDFLTKPSASQMNEMRETFPAKLLQVSRAKVWRLSSLIKIPPPRPKFHLPSKSSKLIVIGASIGGPQAIRHLIPRLPPDFPAPILVIQHLPKGYSSRFIESLAAESQILVKEAAPFMPLRAGTVFVAPGGKHLVLNHQKKIMLTDDPPVNSVRPSIDVTLVSCAQLFKKDLIAVILTGMGKDGTKGAVEVKLSGGIVIAESEASCVVYGMSKSVIEAGACDFAISLEKIPDFIMEKLTCQTN